MIITPMNSLPTLTVCTPVGTEGVGVVGEKVIGRWGSQLTDFYGPRGRLLVEDFVNWPSDPKQIVRFTALYAPLSWHREVSFQKAQPGRPFQFELDDWRHSQKFFKTVWEAAVLNDPPVRSVNILPENDVITMRDGKLVYVAGMLRTFLAMELFKLSPERLRKCPRPGCETPYFVARHLRQQYCSPACAEWAQAQWKKQWWEEEGKSWLKGRKKKSRKRG